MHDRLKEIKTISSRKNIWDINLYEIWSYRDLIYYFIKREFVSFYKQTILGPLWYLIQPLASSMVYLFLFTKIAKISTGDVPPILFYLSGNVVWMYFSENLIKVSDTFTSNSNIFGKVYFPRLTVPISVILSGMISFFIQILLLICFIVFYSFGDNFSLNIFGLVYLPFIILDMMVITFAFGLIISSLTTKYRDLKFVLRFGIQLWLFASPVAYSSNMIPIEYKDFFLMNPISPVIEAFRYAFFGSTALEMKHIWFNLISVFMICMFSVFIFNKVEKDFVDTV